MMGLCTECRRQLPRALVCKEQLDSGEAAATKVEGWAAAVWGEGDRRWRQLIHNLTLPLPPPLWSIVAGVTESSSFQNSNI